MNLIGGGRLIELDTLASLSALRDRALEEYIASSLPMSDAALALSHALQSLQALEVSDSAALMCTSTGSSSIATRSSNVFCISVAGIVVLSWGAGCPIYFSVFVRTLWRHRASIRRVPLFN